MGLNICVGYLADLLEQDEEGAENFRETIAVLNDFLTLIGLPAHSEPEKCVVLSADVYGYSGLHYLRRVAAHLDLQSGLPPPGGKDAAEDHVMKKYYTLAGRAEPGFFARLFRQEPPRRRTFDHLLLHSDAEGYYLPQDFPEVLFPPKKYAIPGAMIGSSARLLEECKRLADALKLPLELNPESDEVWQAMNSQGEGSIQWKRYGIESYACLRLHAASQHSLKTGAAIVFC